MNNDETYTPCTKCGRPMAYCKGQCCGKQKNCQCEEYCGKACGVIRPRMPDCLPKAVIPSLTVESSGGLKDLADCFVHVSDINTTFYIDDKHHFIETWAGPVEYDNYNLNNNPLGLRSQFLVDFANEQGAYYDKAGAYRVFKFEESANEPVRLLVGWDGGYYPEGWEDVDVETGARIELSAGHANITRFQIPNDRLYFEREDTGAQLNASQVYGLLESGKRVILDHVPLGAYYPYSASDNTIFAFAYADNVELSNRVYDEGAESAFVSYTGGAYMPCIEADVHTYLGVQIRREVGTQTVSFLVDGRGHFRSN